MATSIELDNNNEIVFNEAGECCLVSDEDDVMQAIRVELCQNKGQWLLNSNFGVPWLNKNNTGILQGKIDKKRIINEISQVIKKYEIDRIKKIDFTEDDYLLIEVVLNGEEKELKI